jgi:hypothetical protein
MVASLHIDFLLGFFNLSRYNIYKETIFASCGAHLFALVFDGLQHQRMGYSAFERIPGCFFSGAIAWDRFLVVAWMGLA